MDMDAFLQSFSEDYVEDVDQVGILENGTDPLPVSPHQVTFTYKLEGMEYETILPSPSPTYQLPMDTRLVDKMGNNNSSSSSVTGEAFYPGELTPPVSLYSSPLQDAQTGLLINQTNKFVNKQKIRSNLKQ